MEQQETTRLFIESCDCNGRVQHNNGGNYHRITELHAFVAEDDDECYCIVLEETTTREAFPRDEYEHLIFNARMFELLRDDQLTNDEYERSMIQFRYGEAKIIAHS